MSTVDSAEVGEGWLPGRTRWLAALLAVAVLTVSGCARPVSGAAYAVDTVVPTTTSVDPDQPDAGAICADIPKSAIEQAFSATGVTINVISSHTDNSRGGRTTLIQCGAITSAGVQILVQRQLYPASVSPSQVIDTVPQVLSGVTGLHALANVSTADAAESFQSVTAGSLVDNAVAAKTDAGGVTALVVSCRDGAGVMDEVVALLTALVS